MILKTAVIKNTNSKNKAQITMPFKKGETPKGAIPFKPGQSGNPNGYTKGVRNRGTTTRMVFDMVGILPDKIFEKLKETVPTIENSMSVEQIIDTIQAFKAIVDKDTSAAKYLKDNLYGAPKQEVDVGSKSVINIIIE